MKVYTVDLYKSIFCMWKSIFLFWYCFKQLLRLLILLGIAPTSQVRGQAVLLILPLIRCYMVTP